MSLKRLIDASVRCSICNKPPGCRCWVKLQCPRCKRTQSTERLESDGDVDVLEVRCPDCADVEGAIE